MDVEKLLRPSSSKRWTHCPGSVWLQAANMDKCETGSSAFAAEGTLAHAVAEAVLKNYRDMPAELATHPSKEEILRHARDYAEVVRDVIGKGCYLFVEESVPLAYTSNLTGTCDAAVWDVPNKTLHIFDLKYGAGVPVVAEGNTQLISYAGGLIEKYSELFGDDIEKVCFTIYQPRCRDDLPAERTWELTYDEFNNAQKVIVLAASSIILEKPGSKELCVSDEACRFCPCAAFCPKRVEELLGDFEDDPLPAPEAISDERIVELMNRSKGIKSFLESIEKYMTRRMTEGVGNYPGWKIVQGTKRRQWRDESNVIYSLSEIDGIIDTDYLETSLLTPAKVRDMLKRKGLKEESAKVYEDFSYTPEGGPTLVPESDKRQAYRPVSAEVEFSDVEE